MELSVFRDYCLAKKGVTEEFPFDQTTLVFKVMGKMFAALDVDMFESINLKCNPERAIDLRERFDGITPGYHMNKQHWNTVSARGNVPDVLIFELTDHSYELVVAGLSAKGRRELGNL
jgi:predicted DNA-binding protein (MmcQ/YjbR family)